MINKYKRKAISKWRAKVNYSQSESRKNYRKLRRQSIHYKEVVQAQNKSPKTRISKALRKRLRSIIFRKIGIQTHELVGCSTDQLKLHLESLFQLDMSWENYGSWHIDHIRPCASFDLNNPEEILQCFHYTNLQPLWAMDNIMKGATYDMALPSKPLENSGIVKEA